MIATFPFSQAAVEIMSKDNYMMLYAAELHFKNETVRAHTGTGDIVIDGQTYIGVGSFGNIGNTEETDEASGPLSIELTLSGLDTSMIANTMADGSRGRAAKVMIVVIDDDGTQAADILFSGRMGAAEFKYGGNSGDNTITVKVVDRMEEWQRRGVKRWTDESHQSRHSGDRFFYAVAQLANWPLYWGAKKDAPSFTYK